MVCVGKPNASGSFSHPPQIVLQPTNAYLRAFWCENEVQSSALSLGAAENGRTIDQQKQLVSVNMALNQAIVVFGRFAVLFPSPAAPEVPPLLKSPSSSLKSFQQSYLEPDVVIERLRGLRRLPVYPQETSWEVLNCPPRKLQV